MTLSIIVFVIDEVAMINDIDVIWRKLLTLAGAGAVAVASCLMAAHASDGTATSPSHNESISAASKHDAEALADANSLSKVEADRAIEALEEQLLSENTSSAGDTGGPRGSANGRAAGTGAASAGAVIASRAVTADEASASLKGAYDRSAAAASKHDARRKADREAASKATATADRKDNATSSRDSDNVSHVLDSGAAKASDIGGGKELVLERSFSISYIKVPAKCEEDTLKSTCTRLVNYYARRFEREMVSNISIDYDESDPFNKDNFKNSLNRQKSVQHIQMSVYTHPDNKLMTMFSIFRQRIAGGKEQLLVETINFETATGRVIRFNELFENHQLAAMLCARAIEAHYRKYNSPLLPVVISATELSPSNFIITPRGLRFFFAPGLVKPDSKIAESMLVGLNRLKTARPDSRWWSGKNIPVTEEEKKALANSALAGVISLDENSNLEKINAINSRRQAEGAADQIASDVYDDEAMRGQKRAVVKVNEK